MLLTADYGFRAQMFKDKCQEWNFVKNIPRKLAGKLMRIADERKPKDTEFRIGPRKWTTAEIKKKCERGLKNGDSQICGESEKQTIKGDGLAKLMIESPELPSNLTYRTPTVSPVIQNALVRQGSLSIQNSPARYFYTGSAMPVRRWTPEVPGPVTAPGRPWTPFNIASPRATASSWAPISSPRQTSISQGRILHAPPFPVSTTSFSWQKTMPTSRPLLSSPQLPTTQDSLQDIKSKRSSASRLLRYGKVEHAIERLRVVVSGFETLLSPTHQLTVETSYELAELLGSHDNMGEANALLDWLGSELVYGHGLRSERTILHYVKVVKLLRSWSRDEDARLLIYKIADVWDRGHPCPAPKIPGLRSENTVLGSIPKTDIKKVFREPVDESDADVQLQLLEMLLSSTNDLSSELEEELTIITSYCENGQMTPQTIHARHCLSRFYASRNMKEKAMQVLDAVIPALEQALDFDDSDPPSSHLLQHCRAIAFDYYDLDHQVKCEDILELTAASLEQYTHPHGPVPQTTAVDFPVATGLVWQKRYSWELAEPWFERALLNSIKSLGKSHEKTVMLEETLEERSPPFTLDDILSRSEIDHITSM